MWVTLLIMEDDGCSLILVEVTKGEFPCQLLAHQIQVEM